MKIFRTLCMIGCWSFVPLSLLAQKKVPYSFHYQMEAAEESHIQELTQVSYPGTNSIRLYFEEVKLGPNSYLLLEGTDGAEQKMDAAALKNWNNSSAYFNGQNVKLSLYQAAGENASVKMKEIKVNDKGRSQKASPKINTTMAQARSTSNDELPPWAAAVGRFTNGSNSYGTGWIAPNGAIVTSENIAWNFVPEGYDLIEFNVPLSNPDGSVNHPGPEDQYPVITNFSNGLKIYFRYKNRLNLEAENEPGLEIAAYRCDVAIVEALPNSTGQRPGERQQQYFRIAANPGSFILEGADFDIDILHYGSYDGDIVFPENSKTLRMTTATMLPPSEYIRSAEFVGDGHMSDDDMVLYYGDGEKPFSSSRGAPITYHNSNVAIGVHHTNYVHAPSGALGFANDFWRDKLDRFFTNNGVYVDTESLYQPGNGDIHKPYHQLADAVSNAADEAILYLAKGSYNESVTINRPMTLKAAVGVVKIGTSEGNNARSKQALLPPELFAEDEKFAFDELESIEENSLLNFPNPFSDRTEMHYTLQEDSPVTVKVYDMLGGEVSTLVQEEQHLGKHNVQWNGRNHQGRVMPTGIYIIQLKTGEETSAVRVVKQ